MLDPDERARLDALAKRIEAAKAVEKPRSAVAEHHSQAQAGWRMVTELVAGLLIGFGIGYGLDAVFGTLPWFLVVFTLAGFAAGVRVMLRTAQELSAGTTNGGQPPAARNGGPEPADEGKRDGR